MTEVLSDATEGIDTSAAAQPLLEGDVDAVAARLGVSRSALMTARAILRLEQSTDPSGAMAARWVDIAKRETRDAILVHRLLAWMLEQAARDGAACDLFTEARQEHVSMAEGKAIDPSAWKSLRGRAMLAADQAASEPARLAAELVLTSSWDANGASTVCADTLEQLSDLHTQRSLAKAVVLDETALRDTMSRLYEDALAKNIPAEKIDIFALLDAADPSLSQALADKMRIMRETKDSVVRAFVERAEVMSNN